MARSRSTPQIFIDIAPAADIVRQPIPTTGRTVMRHPNVNLWLLTVILSAPVWSAAVASAQCGGQICVVTNVADSAPGAPLVAGSLRFAMSRARIGDSVIFDPAVFAPTNSDADTTIDVLSPLPELADGGVTI